MENAFTGPIANCEGIRRDVIWANICLQHTWNTDWNYPGGLESLPLKDWGALLQEWANSELISSCQLGERDSLPHEQKVSRKFASGFRLGERQFHLEHGIICELEKILAR
jgi:hypothetical protein